MNNINNRKDILLLLLYSPGLTGEINEPIIGRTRLVKMMFLFKEEALKHFKKGTDINENNFYSFFAWNFGPFSKEVYDDLNFFEYRGYIERKKTKEDTIPEAVAEWNEWVDLYVEEDCEDSITEYEEEAFLLTSKGCDFTKEKLYNNLSVEQKKILSEFKSRIQKVPLRALLKYVYENYPNMTSRSIIKEMIIGDSN